MYHDMLGTYVEIYENNFNWSKYVESMRESRKINNI